MRKLAIGVLLVGLAAVPFSIGARVSIAAQILPGDLLVTISNATEGGPSEIVDINPQTGFQTLVASGGDLIEPNGLAVDSSENIIVSDYGGNFDNSQGSIIRINPNTGQQTIVASGGNLIFPSAVAIDSSGNLITTAVGTSQVAGEVVKVNPQTGAQTPVASGSPLFTANGLAIDANGNYFVSNWQDQSYGTSIVKVNPTTGAQTVVWSGYSFDGAYGIAEDDQHSGDLLVAYDPDPASMTAILDANTATGGTTIVSQNGLLTSPIGVVQDASGDIFAANSGGSIVEIDPTTGDQTLIASGGYLENITAIAIVPEPTSLAILGISGMVLLRRKHA